MNKEKVEELKKLMEQIHNRNKHAMEYDYESGSMWEAYDTGQCQGRTEVAQTVIEFINALQN